jgi:hypothetical protein
VRAINTSARDPNDKSLRVTKSRNHNNEALRELEKIGLFNQRRSSMTLHHHYRAAAAHFVVLVGSSTSLALTAVVGLSLAGNAAASIIENTVDTMGLSEPIVLAYGDHTANAAITPGVDVDGYRFSGAAGDALRVVVTGHSSGFDPLIELRDPVGTVLQTQSCDTSPFTCAVNLDQSLTSTGVHFLNILDSGNSEPGSYTLHLDRYSPIDNWDGIAYDAPLVEQLGHAGDHDFLAFQGAGGTGVRINVVGNSSGLDPTLQVWDPAGALIFDNFCDTSPFTCSFFADLVLPQTGVYRVGIFDAGFSEIGTYSLNVSCTFGACPTGAPTPTVPVPAALPLFATGLLGLAGVMRRRRG